MHLSIECKSIPLFYIKQQTDSLRFEAVCIRSMMLHKHLSIISICFIHVNSKKSGGWTHECSHKHTASSMDRWSLYLSFHSLLVYRDLGAPRPHNHSSRVWQDERWARRDWVPRVRPTTMWEKWLARLVMQHSSNSGPHCLEGRRFAERMEKERERGRMNR